MAAQMYVVNPKNEGSNLHHANSGAKHINYYLKAGMIPYHKNPWKLQIHGILEEMGNEYTAGLLMVEFSKDLLENKI